MRRQQSNSQRQLTPRCILEEKIKATYFDAIVLYNYRDRKRVAGLVETLARHGIRVFFDQYEIVPGDDIHSIKRIIENVPCRLVVFSRSGVGAMQSMELQWCLEQKNGRLIPVKLQETRLPAEVEGLFFVDLSRGLRSNEFSKLVRGIFAFRGWRSRQPNLRKEIRKRWQCRAA
jgi:hypothetical protein